MRTSSTPGFIVALSTILLFAGCAINPVTGSRNFTLMSEADEMNKGRQAAAEIQKKYDNYDLPALQNYVNTVGQKLAKKSHRPQLEYHFTVVDSPQVNAFALPGGYIYVTRGILAYLNSEAELAAVLGHEIGHVTARHSVRQYSAATAANAAATVGGLVAGIFMPQLGGQLAQGFQSLLGFTGSALLSGYGRSHELEADRLGAEYLARSGYDPQAMIKVIGVLKNQELFDIEVAKQEGREPRRYHGIFATHPDNDTRLQEVVSEANQYIEPAGTDDRRAEFLRQTDGMVFGDAVNQGVVRGSTFRHKEMGFMLSFPPDWRVRNKPDEVVATSPDGDALMALSLFDTPRGSPADFARERFRLESSDQILSMTNNGLPVAVVTSTTQNGEPFKAGVIYHDSKAYLLAGKSDSPAAFDRYRAVISNAIESFRALTDAERESIKPLEIRTITARKGLSYTELARNSPLGVNAENYLRLLNGQYPEGEPVPGQKIKIVK
ncbi:putative Zn-dependent protease [Nitrosospira sp. Nsp5]|uniref:Zn-dependent protease n=1 Tax=Nitrosospira multiformis TaxID=1231 RepID=A0ABY0TK53_9PROT|nr:MULTISPECIES: M48 family metalloprotease [Nitrosospira]PTR10150.1 putative Zn-dependent protease [Nitrosospira sp. Nsp5]SDQ96316.1 Putative Zn-dependent protease [Nitrosospira multiformis]